jgi:regulator of sirC expression with transglutaminase-like and TPR domain
MLPRRAFVADSVCQVQQEMMARIERIAETSDPSDLQAAFGQMVAEAMQRIEAEVRADCCSLASLQLIAVFCR